MELSHSEFVLILAAKLLFLPQNLHFPLSGCQKGRCKPEECTAHPWCPSATSLGGHWGPASGSWAPLHVLPGVYPAFMWIFTSELRSYTWFGSKKIFKKIGEEKWSFPLHIKQEVVWIPMNFVPWRSRAGCGAVWSHSPALHEQWLISKDFPWANIDLIVYHILYYHMYTLPGLLIIF